ncbi:MAG: thermonuclease family protein [Proteobacteria bacterium]|nr:thermonuclease family protein [Pseudomonadota bacterium]
MGTGRLIAGLIAAMAVATPARAEPPCIGSAAEGGTVAAVQDGRTLTLADGREVRLAGIEAPADNAALRTLVSGRSVRLEGTGEDRYGRLIAYAYLPDDAEPVQAALLAAGQARVSARVGAKSCADALLAAEKAARAAGRGRWPDPNFAPLGSQNLTMIAAARGHFALIEGRVLSVRESGATIYVNFGRRWTRDFSVIIPKRSRGSFAAAGIDIKALEGRRIRVRGTIEQRSGPIVQAIAPEQIELIG